VLSVPSAPAASAAPAGIRMNVCTASQIVSSAGILSAKNSAAHMMPAMISTAGC
jgi:hypothetical protein